MQLDVLFFTRLFRTLRARTIFNSHRFWFQRFVRPSQSYSLIIECLLIFVRKNHI